MGKGVHNPYLSQNPEDYRIRVDCGWNNISGASQKDLFKRKDLGITPDNFNKALDRINKSYYLTMVDHEFDLKENGSVELKINYRAYIETALQDKHLDALATPALIAMRRRFGKELQDLIDSDPPKCSKKEFDELRATYAAIEDELRLASYQSIMKRMLKRGNIHFCKFNRNQIGSGFKLKGGKVFEGKPKLEWPEKGGTFGTKI